MIFSLYQITIKHSYFNAFIAVLSRQFTAAILPGVHHNLLEANLFC